MLTNENKDKNMLKNKAKTKMVLTVIVALLILSLILLLSIKGCHKHEYKEVVTEPTCTEKGYTTYTCSCGDSYKDNETEALRHTYGEWEVVKEATEEETGLQERKCSRCNETETQVIPSLTHTHTYTSVVTNPTCVDKGYTTYTCKCGDSYKDNEVDALGHTYSDWKVVKEATETETGLKEKECIICKDKVTEEISKLEHTHSYTTVVTEPTCTEKGYTTYTCSCGDSYKDSYTEVIPHTYSDWKIVKEATEEETGLKERKCNNCSELETQTIPSLTHTHTYTSVVTNPTCVDKGYTTYTCTCGDTYKDNEVDALGHAYSDWKVVKEATETETGLKEKECSICNDKVTEEISKLEHTHTYTTVVTEPTCVDKGYTTYTCSCGDSYKDNETEALDHDYNECSKINSTCNKLGAISYKCIYCGDIQLEVIDYADHKFVIDTCSVCGLILMGKPYEENEYTYINFGKYPQTVVTDTEIIEELKLISSSTNSLGYIEYKGKEYKKVVAKPYYAYYSPTSYFMDGREIVEGNTYYYLVEPIKWRLLSENDNTYMLLCEMVIDNTDSFYQYDVIRELDGHILTPNNYEFSNIRAWLNGYNGTDYDVTDYTNIGFYDIAFTEEEKAMINTTFVDNSVETTDNINDQYVGANTYDKIYLLSYKDMTNPAYGFSSDYTEYDPNRIGQATDYARGNGCITDRNNVYTGYATWTLRSPYTDYFANSSYVTYDGYVKFDFCNGEHSGVRPSITITKEGHTHSYTTHKIVDATCVNKGYSTYICECDNYYIDYYIDWLDHEYTTVVKESTCQLEGYTTYTCKSCSYSYRDDYTSQLDHSYISKITYPTCKESGFTVYTCNSCGDTYTSDYTNIIDHNYVNNKCSMCGKLNIYEENGYSYINLGKYPQSVVTDESIISALSNISNTNSLGYIEYNGKEYKKLVASTYNGNSYNFINGNAIINGNIYYYLVEPIKWRVLSEDDNTYTLMCEMIIDNTNFYYSKDEIRRFKGVAGAIYANNYEYSNIRAWLNGYNGSAYNVTDYTNIGFYDIAFTDEEKAIINTTLVDNSAETTDSSTNRYVCNNTYDKVYLLSYQDLINTKYGFSSQENYADKARRGQTTDYLRSKGYFMSTKTDYYGNAEWWLRTPYSGTMDRAGTNMKTDGNLFYFSNPVYTHSGIRPVITITE